MNRMCHQFLACSGFTGDQDRQVGARDSADDFHYFNKGGANAHEIDI